jgi:hypothetical protein
MLEISQGIRSKEFSDRSGHIPEDEGTKVLHDSKPASLYLFGMQKEPKGEVGQVGPTNPTEMLVRRRVEKEKTASKEETSCCVSNGHEGE